MKVDTQLSLIITTFCSRPLLQKVATKCAYTHDEFTDYRFLKKRIYQNKFWS